MAHVTKLDIRLELLDGDDIESLTEGLPEYSRESFRCVGDNVWHGDFIVTCPVAPELAEGDFVDDLSPYFRTLLEMKKLHGAEYDFEIALGGKNPDSFRLDSYSVALLSALGASVKAAMK